MSSMSNAVENALVDYYLRGMALPAPLSTIFISLHVASPGDTGANELPSSNAYVRAAVTTAYNTWSSTQGTTINEASSGTSGQSTNKVVITYQTPTPNGWGTVTHFGVWSQQTNGVFMFGGMLTVPKTINAGDAVTWPIDSLVAQFA